MWGDEKGKTSDSMLDVLEDTTDDEKDWGCSEGVDEAGYLYRYAPSRVLTEFGSLGD